MAAEQRPIMHWFLQTVIPERPAAERNWRQRAACRFIDPELFFPISDSGPSLNQVTRAKAVCAACAVKSECLAFAVRTRQNHGIWGGMTKDERDATVKRAGLRPRPAQTDVIHRANPLVHSHLLEGK
jgi:WhiB family transcriptional regulator, redox-sensing transcriptional regulator